MSAYTARAWVRVLVGGVCLSLLCAFFNTVPGPRAFHEPAENGIDGTFFCLRIVVFLATSSPSLTTIISPPFSYPRPCPPSLYLSKVNSTFFFSREGRGEGRGVYLGGGMVVAERLWMMAHAPVYR